MYKKVLSDCIISSSFVHATFHATKMRMRIILVLLYSYDNICDTKFTRLINSSTTETTTISFVAIVKRFKN